MALHGTLAQAVWSPTDAGSLVKYGERHQNEERVGIGFVESTTRW
jgi:hypothetical protein